MTEQDWLGCTDPQLMLEVLRGKVSYRKLLLLRIACCRRVWHLLPVGRRRSVEALELRAEKRAGKEEQIDPVTAASNAARLAYRLITLAIDKYGLAGCDIDIAVPAAMRGHASTREMTVSREKAQQCRLTRCIVGPLPFRQAVLDTFWLAWRDGTVRQLAQAAYDERCLRRGTLDPARLAVLADALEEAGCTDPDILNHLRGPGPHVRGCWALDLILGKE